MSALDNWLRQNSSSQAAGNFVGNQVAGNTRGLINRAFLAGSIAEIVRAEGAMNKLKATLKVVRDLTIGTPVLLAGMFGALGKAVKSVLHDTGSLEAALRRLEKIQNLRRIFAPLVGGADAAKRKIAELVLFAQRPPFNLDQWGRAAQILEVFTRGAYSGKEALQDVGDTAAATGNRLEDVADGVGRFSAALRNGQSIAGVADELMQMGVVSAATASHLVSLEQSGASATELFRELKGALSQNRGGMDAMANDLASVTDAYQKAKTVLQEKFGEPFTESEVQNTKNMADAMTALAPTVGRLGQFFKTVFGGFSTAFSSIAKFVAENKAARVAVEALVYVIVGLAAVVSGKAIYSLAVFAIQLGMATSAATALGLAIRVALIGSGIGLLLVALGTAAGILYNFASNTEKASQAVSDQAKAHYEARKAILDQIAAVKTLAEKQAALAAATERVIAAQEELSRLRADNAGGKNDTAIRVARGNVAKATRDLQRVRDINPNTLIPGEMEARQQEAERDRARVLETETFQAAMEKASPEGRLRLLAQRRAVLEKRAGEAESGINSAAAVERERDVRESEFQRLRAQGASPGRLRKAEAEVLDTGLAAPETSSVFAETMARKIEHSMLAAGSSSMSADEQARHAALAGDVKGDARALSFWRQFAAQQRAQEENLGTLSGDLTNVRTQQEMEQRQFDLTEARVKAEKEISELRSRGFDRTVDEAAIRLRLLDKERAAALARGDSQGVKGIEAERARLLRNLSESERERAVSRSAIDRDLAISRASREGRSELAVSLSDLSNFAERFEQLRSQGFGDDEARKRAQALSNEDIFRSAFELERSGVVDSLQRIGGGGGVSQDPMLTVAERQASLLKEANEYLKQIAGQAGAGTSTEPNPDQFD